MKCVVCGGGISGLSAAYYVSKLLSRHASSPYKVILIEKSKNVGGWMKTNVLNGDRQAYDGPINEQGPRSVRSVGTVGNNTLQLVSDLGLEEDIIPVKSSDAAAKKRLIYINKALHEVPNSFSSMFSKRPPFSKSLVKFIVPGLMAKVPSDYETMYEVSSSRFGKEVADYLIDSFTRGVFAADSRHLSMKAAFPQLWKLLGPKNASMPRKPQISKPDVFNKTLMANPLIKRAAKERWTQWGISKGFSHFTEEFSKYLTQNMNVEILRSTEVEEISINKDDQLTIKLLNKESGLPSDEIKEVDHFISALPSHQLSKILRRTSSQSADKNHSLHNIGLTLSHIRWVDVAVTNVEFDGAPETLLPTVGFGHLVPSMEPSKVLGIVYDSCVFPDHDRLGSPTTRLTCMMGGSWFKELFGDPETMATTTAEQAALESISEQLGIVKDPLNMDTNVCLKSIPMYGVGHTDIVEDIEDMIEENELPISLVGASYWGVSINDCIFNSRIAAYNIMRKRGMVD